MLEVDNVWQRVSVFWPDTAIVIKHAHIPNIAHIMAFVVFRASSRCHLTRLKIRTSRLRRAWTYEGIFEQFH